LIVNNERLSDLFITKLHFAHRIDRRLFSVVHKLGLRENLETEIAIGDMRIHGTYAPNHPIRAGRERRHQGDVKQSVIAAI
jgi:hypothetical protein